MSNYLTITLTGRPPVRIDKDVWKVEACSTRHDGRLTPSDANRRWEAWVRVHPDGRRIVYGTYWTRWEGERERRDGCWWVCTRTRTERTRRWRTRWRACAPTWEVRSWRRRSCRTCRRASWCDGGPAGHGGRR